MKNQAAFTLSIGHSFRITRLVPGICLATVVAIVAWTAQTIEERWLGHAVFEALVIAILLGMAYRTWGVVSPHLLPGIAFTSKNVLEFAIVLLGASIDLPAVVAAGPALFLAIGAVVVIGISTSAMIGRLIGLNPKLAILVAVGNSICGNSAIAAVAPVIAADAEDVASSIALTAVLGVGVVLALPLLIPLLHFSFYQYGVLAGMTVYAVPQVVAATFPVSAVSGEIGTLVKLVRVLMLGPVVLFFSLRRGARRAERGSLPIHRLVPWFIVGFIALGACRSSGVLPVILAEPLRETSRYLTVVAMAALGLSVDVRVLFKVGRAVALAVISSLAVLIAVSVMLICVLHIG